MSDQQGSQHFQSSQRAPSSSRRCFPLCSREQYIRSWRSFVAFCERLLYSYVWKALNWLFTALLLFGSPVQFLWFPKQGDVVFDILYSIAFSFFIFDMMFHLLVDPEYFHIPRRPRFRKQQPYQPILSTCGVGSFMFWCDLVSAAAVAYDISWTNPGEYAMVEHSIKLDDIGVPVSSSSLLEKLSVCCFCLIYLLTMLTDEF